MEKDKYPTLSTLAYICFEINAVAETRDVSTITFDYVYKGIKEKNLLEKLQSDFKEDIDLSLFQGDPEKSNAVYYVLARVAESLSGVERRKVGIEKSGQRLLLAFLIEAIQKQMWHLPK
jgi:hypothetical protein